MEIASHLNDSKVFKKDFSEYGQILNIELSPFILSQDLILIGFESRVILGHLRLEDQTLDLDILAEFTLKSRCSSLSISPETSTSILPNNIIFAVACKDFKVRVFRSDLRGDDVCKVLSDHNSYINDVKFDPDNNFLASVSDDNTAKLWETEDFKCVVTLQLTSPGISACWHKEDNSKLLIAEKIGLIRFYNVETQNPILSLDYGKPLSCTHWAPSDSQFVASLQLGELLIWDLSKPCVPATNTLVFTEAGGHVRFNAFGDLVAAINNLDSTLKVVDIRTNQVKLAVSVVLPSNVNWHCRYPLVCLGDYMTLTFWKVVSK
ncbi:nucleoporin Nup37 [Tribolium madens]|uniref:nucleoporin Nup37 n=1 Tax=Tribolium madens TaxID=41895 RepID=UPI001CF7535F|nr:nucleoporin Nup37 [Tribolium madens]